VPHKHLLLKLQSLGIHGKVLPWLRLFLTKRKQRVVINGTYSDWATVTSGVPQGTVLGTLLFLIYVNDLDSVVMHSTVIISCLLMTFYIILQLVMSRNVLPFKAISSWASYWQLKLNPSKCEALMITNNKHKSISFTYFVNNQSISWSNMVKYLGVQVDSKLN